MELFAPKEKRAKHSAVGLPSSSRQRVEVEKVVASPSTTTTTTTPASTFADLGLCEWICHSASAMGFRWPTEIQRMCIPAVLSGRDVMGCAETGSGKTAAFALPILHHLSQDPYGIFAVVLTPTRELAIQISEQFIALGAPMGLRVCLVIGGVGMTDQSLQLTKRPHVVIATPGRLRHHLEGPDPPIMSKAVYLVLDEADRLLASGFSSELGSILSHMSSSKRQTLLFSATLTSSLVELEKLAMKNTLKFDLTSAQRVPSQMTQQYLFVPAQVKVCYLVAVLHKILQRTVANDDDREIDDRWALEDGKSGKKKATKRKKDIESDIVAASSSAPDSSVPTSSIIIFVGTCRRCQEVAEILNELGIDCVALHSMMTQLRRIAALGKFKSQLSRILIATDVASRGLDIPTVDVVINLDLPKLPVDYIHRIGRTARAGRGGRSLSLVTQYDVNLVHAIEGVTEIKLELSDEVKETDVLPLLNSVAKAIRMSQMRLTSIGFEEKLSVFEKRKRTQRKSLQKKKKQLTTATHPDENQ